MIAGIFVYRKADGRRKNCYNAVFSRRHNETFFCERDKIEAQQKI